MSGYCVTGSLSIPSTPSSRMIIETTVDSTGLSMKTFSMSMIYLKTGLRE